MSQPVSYVCTQLHKASYTISLLHAIIADWLSWWLQQQLCRSYSITVIATCLCLSWHNNDTYTEMKNNRHRRKWRLKFYSTYVIRGCHWCRHDCSIIHINMYNLCGCNLLKFAQSLQCLHVLNTWCNCHWHNDYSDGCTNQLQQRLHCKFTMSHLQRIQNM